MPATPRWLSEAERETWRDLTLMHFQLFALLGRELAPSGLSFQDYVVLAELSDRPDHRARLRELGDLIGWEKSRVSHHVTRMERRGLVERRPCPDDRRGAFVVMTDEGRRAIAAAAPDHVAVVRRHVVDVLTPEQFAALGATARAVLAAMAPDA